MDTDNTFRTEKIFQNVKRDCEKYGNNIVTPFHFLKILIEDQSSGFYIYLPKNKRKELTEMIRKKIESFPRSEKSSKEPHFSSINFFKRAVEFKNNRKDDFLGQNHLILSLLEENDIKNFLQTILTEEEMLLIKNKMTEVKKIDSLNADDLYDANDTDSIKEFVQDLVEEAKNGKLDPIIGRENETKLVMEVLGKKSKSNVILVGMPGVGKTAIVTGFAAIIAKGETTRFADNKILSLNVGALMSGTAYRGEFEKKITKLIDVIRQNSNCILFIDEIHTILNMGNSGEGALDAANILKPFLSSGEIKVIGATTHDEYRKHIEKDPAFERRFTKITVNESSPEDTLNILRGLRSMFEAHHGIKISDEALVYSANNAKRYISGRRLPDVSIDIVDTACASKLMDLESEPQELTILKKQIWSLELEKRAISVDLEREMDKEKANHNNNSNQQENEKIETKRKIELIKKLEKVRNTIEETKTVTKELENKFATENFLIYDLKRLKQEKQKYLFEISEAERENNTHKAYDLTKYVIPQIEEKIKEIENVKSLNEIVTPNDIAKVISQWTGIPVDRLSLKSQERLRDMEQKLNNKVFGQNVAIEHLVNTIVSSRLGFGDPNKPSSFLLIGPTGVGKTELAKAISFELFDEESYLKLDMSDYSSEISVSKLVGAPAGYVGYNEGGTLTEPIRQKPYNLILLDEIDHAHKKVLNLLYQLLDEGRLVDGKGNIVNFKNTVIIMTSNLGQDVILNDSSNSQMFNESATLSKIQPILSNFFGAPLLNRIDKIQIFKPLEIEELAQIFDYNFKVLVQRFYEKKVLFKISSDVISKMIENCYDPNNGARPLKKYMERIFVAGVSKCVLKKETTDYINVYCDTHFSEDFKFIYNIDEYHFFIVD